VIAGAGDYVVVPTQAPHTFSNPFDEDAEFFNTFTPAFYINYLRMLSQLESSGVKLGKEQVIGVMARYATLPVMMGEGQVEGQSVLSNDAASAVQKAADDASGK